MLQLKAKEQERGIHTAHAGALQMIPPVRSICAEALVHSSGQVGEIMEPMELLVHMRCTKFRLT